MILTTYEALEQSIEQVDGLPTVLEALWDGDTQGWFLVLNLYCETRRLFGKRTKYINLGIVRFGDDIRLFNGEVPSWPEAELAREWGNKAAEKYGLTFYFPSATEPDNDCPRWTQRNLGIQCADCGKLIIPTDSLYLPKDICYPCHLKREFNSKLQQDLPEDGGVMLYITNGHENIAIHYSTYFKDFTIAPFIQHHIPTTFKEVVNVIELDQPVIIDLKEQLEKAIDLQLIGYQKPVIEAQKTRFIKLIAKEYKGIQYELMDRFNHEHEQLAALINSFQTAEKALAEGYYYQLVFKNGITYRDDSFLRFVHFVEKGATTLSRINDRYASTVSAEAMLGTVNKLVSSGCIALQEEQVSITPRGKLIL